MIITISIMLLGILVGVLSRYQPNIIKVSSKLTDISIYLLLLFLGISVGANEQVWKSLSTIGLTALTISLTGVIGSVIVSFFVYKFFFEKNER